MNEETRPLCTVVIPLYNKAATIGRAVESVQRQSYRGWTLIIVDDGSSDNGVASLNEYAADSRVRIISQDNRGPGSARNVGLSLARTPYVAFLDADDEWEPTFLETLIGELEANPSASMAICSWVYGEMAIDSRVKRNSLGIVSGAWRLERDLDYLFSEVKARIDSIHSSAVVVRTSTIEKYSGFFENHSTYGEDAYLWGQFVFAGESIIYSDDVLLKFHTDASSLSYGRRSAYPVPPVLQDPEGFTSSFESWRRIYALRYLADYALYVSRRAVSQRAPLIVLKSFFKMLRIRYRLMSIRKGTVDE